MSLQRPVLKIYKKQQLQEQSFYHVSTLHFKNLTILLFSHQTWKSTEKLRVELNLWTATLVKKIKYYRNCWIEYEKSILKHHSSLLTQQKAVTST